MATRNHRSRPTRRVDVLGADPATIGRRPDTIAIRDDFACGPLPPLGPLRPWAALRRTFWREAFGELRRPYADPARWSSAPEVVVWVGTGLGDQLLLAWVLGILRSFGRDPDALRVVQFGTLAGVEVSTLGMVSPTQSAEFPAPARLSAAGVAELDAAWAAVTAPDPGPLRAFLDDPAAELPFQKRALAHVPARYPDPTTGLGIHDLRLLRHARDRGPRAVHVLVGTLEEAFRTPDRVGDLWLLWRLRRLADPTLPAPPLRLIGSVRELPDLRVELTAFGEELLAGRANHAEVNGVDDWVCGVHFRGPARRP